jgi:small conductance mechanosensitive channel
MEPSQKRGYALGLGGCQAAQTKGSFQSVQKRERPGTDGVDGRLRPVQCVRPSTVVEGKVEADVHGRGKLAQLAVRAPARLAGACASLRHMPLEIPVMPQSVLHDVGVIALLAVVAWAIHRASWVIARQIVAVSRFAARVRDERPLRRATLQGVVADAISFAGVAAAIAIALVRVFDVAPDTIVWSVGLFSVAFGLAARPILSDMFAGTSLLFEDNYVVGEKVEMAGVVGVVEMVALRTTRIRGDTGELFVLPNGEIRVVRNFSRGEFSTATVTVRVAASELDRTVTLLTDLGTPARDEFPELANDWRVISETGLVAATAEVTVFVSTAHARAADLRPRLMASLVGRLASEGIALSG